MAAKGIKLSAKQRKILRRKVRAYGTNRAVGDAVGCTGQAITLILNGTNKPGLDTLRKLCKVIGCEFRMDMTIDGV